MKCEFTHYCLGKLFVKSYRCDTNMLCFHASAAARIVEGLRGVEALEKHIKKKKKEEEEEEKKKEEQ